MNKRKRVAAKTKRVWLMPHVKAYWGVDLATPGGDYSAEVTTELMEDAVRVLRAHAVKPPYYAIVRPKYNTGVSVA